MTKLLRSLGLALLLAGLSGCANVPDEPILVGMPVPQGNMVALGQSVRVGAVVATPMEVVEDSRCPINARCVWAGRLVVRTRIDGPGWRETDDLTLGEPYRTHNVVIALTSGEPGRETGTEIAPTDYRFTYEAK